ncbi:MAG: hypothetical protein R2742_12545 [Micropruina glycogenica]
MQPLLTVLQPDPVIGQSRHGSIDHSHQGRIVQLLEGQLHASNATHRPLTVSNTCSYPQADLVLFFTVDNPA